MDLTSWIALGGVTLLNVFGWVYTKVYTYGGLTQKVKNLEGKVDDGLVEKVDGLVGKVSEVSVNLAKLEGTVHTYIELTKK